VCQSQTISRKEKNNAPHVHASSTALSISAWLLWVTPAAQASKEVGDDCDCLLLCCGDYIHVLNSEIHISA
jgi:hypothetical protein